MTLFCCLSARVLGKRGCVKEIFIENNIKSHPGCEQVFLLIGRWMGFWAVVHNIITSMQFFTPKIKLSKNECHQMPWCISWGFSDFFFIFDTRYNPFFLHIYVNPGYATISWHLLEILCYK
jgi:hypothetical protein